MKEYVSKEDVMNWIHKNIEEPNGALKITFADNQIENIPTVTEAKICRKFLNKVAITFPKTLLELWETVDMMLEEMEKGE